MTAMPVSHRGIDYQGFSGATGTPIGLRVTPAALTVPEGGTRTYEVKLDRAPSDTVTVTPTVEAQSSGKTVATVSGPLTFTTSDWYEPQKVKVTGVPDDDTRAETATVTHSARQSGMEVEVTSGEEVMVTVKDTVVAHADRVRRTVLPQVAAAMASQSLDAVAGRIEAATSGEAGRSVQLGTLPEAPRSEEWADSLLPNERWEDDRRDAEPSGPSGRWRARRH